MWSHKQWFGSLFPAGTQSSQALGLYAKLFNSIEGNTGLYQIPDITSTQKWADAVPSEFRFTFKFHQDISHTHQLSNVEGLVNKQLDSLTPIIDKLGCMLLQLPATFAPNKLHLLDTFLSSLTRHIRVAVEVRHLGFFDKQKNEKLLNQILSKHHAARIIMDTRALFSVKQPTDEIVIDVQAKKPKVPTHVVSTTDFVVVRFVGHPDLAQNIDFYAPWINKLKDWILEGKTIYFFVHMPNNALAPWLAEQFIVDFNQRYPELTLPKLNLPGLPNQQISLL